MLRTFLCQVLPAGDVVRAGGQLPALGLCQDKRQALPPPQPHPHQQARHGAAAAAEADQHYTAL